MNTKKEFYQMSDDEFEALLQSRHREQMKELEQRKAQVQKAASEKLAANRLQNKKAARDIGKKISNIEIVI